MLRSLLTTCLTLAAVAAGAAEITLREVATKPRGALVLLGDVATVVGADATRLARLPLMPTPAAGGREFVSSQQIRQMLSAQGESPNQHRFDGAYFVRVSGEELAKTAEEQMGWRPTTPQLANAAKTAFRVRPGASTVPTNPLNPNWRRQQITTSDRREITEDVTEAVQAALDRQVNLDPSQPRVSARDAELSETALTHLLEHAGEPLHVLLPQQSTYEEGPLAAQVRLENDPQSELHRVSVELVKQPLRIVATATLQRGELLVASNVRLEPTPLAELGRPGSVGYTSLEEVVGREAKRPLRAGDVVSLSNTQSPLMAGRGEEVWVTSGGGGVRVRVRGIAKQAGRQGDLIPVQTADGNDTFMARVVGPRTLAVLGGGPSSNGFRYTGGVR